MPLLTTQEVADILRVSTRTVRRFGQDGILERVHVGGRLTRYRADSLDALLNDDGRPASRPNAPAEEGNHDARRDAA